MQSWIQNYNPFSWSLNNFYLSTISANVSFGKLFQNKWKPYFGVIFSQRKFFLKTLAKYNCSGPPPFRCQRYKVDWIDHQTKNYSITISMQKSFNQYPQFIKSFVGFTWFKSPMIYKASLIFYLAHPIIIKAAISFPNLYQHEKNQLISSIHSWNTADFGVSRPKRPCPFPTNIMQKLLK